MIHSIFTYLFVALVFFLLPMQHPDGRPAKVFMQPQRDGTVQCSYTPDDVGRYTVNVNFGGHELPESPYYVKTSPVGRSDLCWIEGENLRMEEKGIESGKGENSAVENINEGRASPLTPACVQDGRCASKCLLSLSHPESKRPKLTAFSSPSVRCIFPFVLAVIAVDE